jgi:hypothetical protein
MMENRWIQLCGAVSKSRSSPLKMWRNVRTVCLYVCLSVCMYKGRLDEQELNQMGQVSESADHIRVSIQGGAKKYSSLPQPQFISIHLGLIQPHSLVSLPTSSSKVQ